MPRFFILSSEFEFDVVEKVDGEFRLVEPTENADVVDEDLAREIISEVYNVDPDDIEKSEIGSSWIVIMDVDDD